MDAAGTACLETNATFLSQFTDNLLVVMSAAMAAAGMAASTRMAFAEALAAAAVALATAQALRGMSAAMRVGFLTIVSAAKEMETAGVGRFGLPKAAVCRGRG